MYISDDKQPNSYIDALISVGVLWLFFALVTGVLAIGVFFGLLSMVWLIIASINLAFWGMILGVTWLLGSLKASNITNFLTSNRPLIRWQYTLLDWQKEKQQRWEEQKEGLFLAPGCLGAIFGFIGMAVGAMVGLEEEGVAEALGYGALGLVAGGLGGALVGGATTGGNYLAAQWQYHKEKPHIVALGRREVLYGRSYFRSNDGLKKINSLTLSQKPEPMLRIQLQNPKQRGSWEEVWMIPVPPHLVEQVAAVLPQIDAGAYHLVEKRTPEVDEDTV